MSFGAYGFALSGLDEPAGYLMEAEPAWPELTLVRTGPAPTAAEAPPAGTVRILEDSAEIFLREGDRIALDRASGTLRFETRTRFSDDAVVHPYLGLPASIAGHWLGRHVFHGGAFIHGDRAWAVLGGIGAGKSSTMAWMLREGQPVLSDDVLVIERRTLFAGPRCVDLRDEAAAVFGGDDLGIVGSRRRWRLHTGATPAAAELGGVIHLAWGDRVSVEPVVASGRLSALAENSVIRPDGAAAAAYLELAALPTYRFVRPRDLAHMDSATGQLLEALV